MAKLNRSTNPGGTLKGLGVSFPSSSSSRFVQRPDVYRNPPSSPPPLSPPLPDPKTNRQSLRDRLVVGRGLGESSAMGAARNTVARKSASGAVTKPVVTAKITGGKSISGKDLIGLGGKGLGKGGARRHRKLLRDNVRGITKGDIRRLARRGGVKRISQPIYEDVRAALTDRLRLIVKDCCQFVEYAKRKTVTVTDVIFALKRQGNLIYGFDKDTFHPTGTTRNRRKQ
ncbi:MAG: hypothetical protein MMC33_003436 [Icmadophila ericetorum]|nr:hypothetical protein [Icmadophila ericetorum]